MAVFGIGAMYSGTEDMSHEFIRNSVACIGFAPSDAPALHLQMSKVKAGDVMFIKSYVPPINRIGESISVFFSSCQTMLPKPLNPIKALILDDFSIFGNGLSVSWHCNNFDKLVRAKSVKDLLHLELNSLLGRLPSYKKDTNVPNE